MIAVIFEVEPADEAQKDEYIAIAAGLRPLLEKIEGFISVERFQSLANPGKLLSLSFFESEEAVSAWRNTMQHRAAQTKGRHEVFSNYRLRIASVIRDYGMFEREAVPQDSLQVHDG